MNKTDFTKEFLAFAKSLAESRDRMCEVVAYIEKNIPDLHYVTKRLIELHLFERAKCLHGENPKEDPKSVIADFCKLSPSNTKSGANSEQEPFTEAHLQELQEKLKLL